MMLRRLTVVAIVVVFCLAGESDVSAGGWGRGGFFARSFSYRSVAPPRYHAPAPYYHHHHHYPTAEELYPKYYGGFHYRHLDNLGIPSGDVGIRGNGIYMSPW